MSHNGKLLQCYRTTMNEAVDSLQATDRDEVVRLLETIERQVYDLRLRQFIFNRVWSVVSEHPKLATMSSHIFPWLYFGHLEACVMAVRRLCDEDDRTVSLVRFLLLLKRAPALVSRSAYGALFPAETVNAPSVPEPVRRLMRERIIENGYDLTVGVGLDQPRGKDFRKEIAELKRLASNVITYANKRVAHHDQEAPSAFATVTDLDNFISRATEIIVKYTLLLKAQTADMNIYFQYDWLAPLRIAWLPEMPPNLPNGKLEAG